MVALHVDLLLRRLDIRPTTFLEAASSWRSQCGHKSGKRRLLAELALVDVRVLCLPRGVYGRFRHPESGGICCAPRPRAGFGC